MTPGRLLVFAGGACWMVLGLLAHPLFYVLGVLSIIIGTIWTRA